MAQCVLVSHRRVAESPIELRKSLRSLDLGRLTIYTFVESVSPDILSTAPEWYVRQAQDQCVERAGKILELCNLVLDLRPSFVPHDPYIAAPMYSAVRVTLWDLYRHPSPSASMKRFAAESCRPVIVLVHRLKKSFAYAGSIVSINTMEGEWSND